MAMSSNHGHSNDKQTVIHLISSLGRGGRERQLAIICKHEKDIRNMIMYYKKDSTDYISEYGLESKLIRVSDKSIWKRIADIKGVINREKNAIIVSWGTMETVVVLLVLVLWHIPFINFSIQHGVRLRQASHYFRSFLARISPYVMANSFAGLAANKIKPSASRWVLYNGIEQSFSKRLEPQEVQARRENLLRGYQNQDIVFISVANLVPFKDYLTVLDALSLLKDDIDFYYLIVGEGPMRKIIEDRVEARGLKNKVRLLGSITNVMDYLQISTCMIHSSRGEGISNAIVEGMFAGLPIIASKVGGIPETVFPESSALFTYQDSSELYSILRRVKQLFTEFDCESKEYCEHLKKFSVETMVTKYESIIRAVTNGQL